MFTIDAYDSMRLNAAHEMRPKSLRWFGNANIGAIERCNLQVPGQLVVGAPGVAAKITTLAARTNLFEVASATPHLRVAWLRYQRMMVSVSVGDRRLIELPLWALFDEHTSVLPEPIIVPWRHNVSVTTECEGSENDDLFYAIQMVRPEEAHLWIHLKGESSADG